MYVPKINRIENQDEIFDFIHKNGFATLVSVSSEGLPYATHIPITLEKNSTGAHILRGHLSRANPHAKLLLENSQALAIFQGAHAYISSSWYTHENVSTWNYTAVHIYGKVRILSDEELWTSVDYLTAKYEANMEKPKFMSDISSDFLKKEIKGIIGFEISLDDVQAKAKMSQNRKDVDYQEIVKALEKIDDGQSQEMSRQMRNKRPV